MNKFYRFYIFILFSSIFIAYTPLIQADTQVTQNSNYDSTEPSQQLSYGEKVGKKALIAFANLVTSPLELPKNIINTINQSNFFYGVFGGFLKGLVNTLGRTGCGIADLLTLPLPTKPIAYPIYIWKDFDVDTTYGDVFRLDNNNIKIELPISQAIPEPIANLSVQKQTVIDHSNQEVQTINKNLDILFKKEMEK
ncbi:MAG: exosortase system-associated protein, TIGR04073 family [Methylococcaceae bacterium]